MFATSEQFLPARGTFRAILVSESQCWYSPFAGGQHQQVWGGYKSELEVDSFDSKKNGSNLETKLLEVRLMSLSKFFYFGPQISILKPAFSNMCGQPFYEVEARAKSSPMQVHLSITDAQ